MREREARGEDGGLCLGSATSHIASKSVRESGVSVWELVVV